jgi:hypothetical protein
MDLALVTALATVVGAAVGGLASFFGTRRRLEFEERNYRRSLEAEAEKLLRRYRDPLIRAAFDLQSRLYNIVVIGFLKTYLIEGSEAEQAYAVDSTLYVVAEYLGWVEIIRLENQFLDAGDRESNKQLAEHLDVVRNILLGRDFENDTFRVFRGEQRAIGELMITRSADGARECIGFASFVTRRSEPAFSRWLNKLEGDVRRVAEEDGPHEVRLIALQHALIDLLDFLDPDNLRFGTRNRERIPLANEGSVSAV